MASKPSPSPAAVAVPPPPDKLAALCKQIARWYANPATRRLAHDARAEHDRARDEAVACDARSCATRDELAALWRKHGWTDAPGQALIAAQNADKIARGLDPADHFARRSVERRREFLEELAHVVNTYADPPRATRRRRGNVAPVRVRARGQHGGGRGTRARRTSSSSRSASADPGPGSDSDGDGPAPSPAARPDLRPARRSGTRYAYGILTPDERGEGT